MSTPGESKGPVLRVLRGGDPTDEELAAITAVLTARTAAGAATKRSLREPLPRWVASGLVKGTRTKV